MHLYSLYPISLALTLAGMDIRKTGDSAGCRDYYFWNIEETRFRSKKQVARFLKLDVGRRHSGRWMAKKKVARKQLVVEQVHGITLGDDGR